MNRILIIFFALFAVYLEGQSQKSEILHFVVESGNYKRINTPVSLSLEDISVSDSLTFSLYEKVSGKLIEKLFQVEAGYISRLWWMLDGTTEPGKKREFYLFIGTGQKVINTMTTNVTSENIVLKKGTSNVLNYRTALLYPPANVDTVYKRNGFIHPLWSPSGNVLTRISPPDHYHHFGIWNPWTRVRIGKHVTDFWNLNEKQGTVRFAGINTLNSGPVFGGFSVRQEHIDFQGSKPEDLVMNEVCDVRAWNTDPIPGINAYLIDLVTYLSVAGDSSLVFEAYRYGGGIGIRAIEEWTKENSAVQTSEGKSRKDADGSRARWTDLNGEFKDRGRSGIVFFSHPSNREHPEPMRVWLEDMNNNRGDVYFEFCPIRFKEWVLDPGKVYRLKYRMLVYDGKIDKSSADRIWNDFAYPPEVKIIGK
jgi:hypothetical protein